jgi:hypothetical protein
LGYWREKGLTARQVEEWMKISDTNLSDIIQSLCHCRYEMVDMKLEEIKPVENVFNWFFRMIERVGHYPAPKGYKSFLAKRIERERQLIQDREREIAEIQAIREKKRSQERELAFQRMMNEPEGELFQACVDRLPPMAKQIDRSGRMFEEVMRSTFEEYLREKEQDHVITT